MINEKQYKLYMSLSDKLDKPFTTMKRWYDDASYPAATCILIEDLTECLITKVDLRPDIFTPSLAQVKLFESFVRNVDSALLNGDVELVISLLNYFEHQCPNLYEQICSNLKESKLGKSLLNQRNEHRQYACG